MCIRSWKRRKENICGHLLLFYVFHDDKTCTTMYQCFITQDYINAHYNTKFNHGTVHKELKWAMKTVQPHSAHYNTYSYIVFLQVFFILLGNTKLHFYERQAYLMSLKCENLLPTDKHHRLIRESLYHGASKTSQHS